MTELANKQPPKPWSKKIGYALLICLAVTISACSRRNWSQATRQSAELAPAPEEYADAVVMAFRARTWGMRGIVADHTWIATKEPNATSYTVYEVIGWRRGNGRSVIRIQQDVPDRHWFGAQPIVMADVRGEQARPLIKKVQDAVASYPYPDTYRAFPGPNSNTFTAWVAKQVPELELELPLRAIGRSYE